MHKILILVFVFFINLTNAETKENQKEKVQFKQIQGQLEKYCYSCSEKSVKNFEKATKKLEEIVHLESKKKKSYAKEILLSDSYERLIYDFYYNNKPKQRTYRTKQYSLLDYLFKNSQSEKEIKLFGIKLEAAYIREWRASKKTSSDPEYKIFKDRYEKLAENIRVNIKKTKINPPEKIKVLTKKSNNLALTQSDIKYIDEIINELFGINNHPTNTKKVYFEYLIDALKNVVELNQLNRDQLSKISRSAIVLQNHHFASKWGSLDDIIWWCEVRSIENKTEQLQLLNNQMLSTKKLDALKMLIELGEVQTIKEWSKKLNFEDSETIFNLAIKQAKLRQATLEKNKKFAQMFQQNLSSSLSEIIQNKRLDNPHEQQHIQWLIIQIGTHRKDAEFKKILENLASDNLFYSTNLTKTMLKAEKKKLSDEIEAQLKISDGANYILSADSED